MNKTINYMNSVVRTILTLILVVLSAFGLFVWLGGEKGSKTASGLVSVVTGGSVESIPATSGAVVSPEVQSLINTLQRAAAIGSLDSSVFGSGVFKGLVDQSIILSPDRNPGRDNPFRVIGDEGQFVPLGTSTGQSSRTVAPTGSFVSGAVPNVTNSPVNASGTGAPVIITNVQSIGSGAQGAEGETDATGGGASDTSVDSQGAGSGDQSSGEFGSQDTSNNSAGDTGNNSQQNTGQDQVGGNSSETNPYNKPPFSYTGPLPDLITLVDLEDLYYTVEGLTVEEILKINFDFPPDDPGSGQ